MADSRSIWKPFSEERESGFNQFKDRVYGIPDGKTLADSDINLQVGDLLPEDSDYEIVSSEVTFVKPRTGTNAHKGGRGVRVSAVKEKVDAAPVGGKLWSELSGTRRIIDTDPQTIRYQITFTAATGSAIPANGSVYSDFTGAGTLTSTDLDREPVLVHMDDRVKATILKDHVTCVFQAHHARVNTASPATEINPRRRVRTGRYTWKGTRRFSIPIASAASFETSLYGGSFPSMSGKYTPKCTRVETLDNWEPGRSLIVADYETPRIIGEGRLRIKIGVDALRTTTNLAGDKVIIGPEFVDDKIGMVEHRLIKGSATRLVPNAIIILETASSEFQVNTFMNRVGHVNKYLLPNFGNAQPGTLLFLGLPDTTFEFKNDLWYLNLAFKYSGDPTVLDGGEQVFPEWNKQTVSQRGSNVVYLVDSLSVDNAVVTGSKSKIVRWVPKIKKTDSYDLGVTQPEVTHQMYPIADFRDMGTELVIRSI